MMETINKKIVFCGLLIMVLLFASLQPTNVKASVPYESYTYNFWLDIVRSPHAYLPDKESTGSSMGTTDLNAPSDLFIADNGYMYIADTNNNRIVWFNQDMEFVDEITTFHNGDTFNQPKGIYVTKDNRLFVADTENERIIEFDANKQFIRTINRPETDLITDATSFRPTKVVVDDAGRIYALAIGINSGIVELNPDGTFQGFMGASEVSVNPITSIWRRYFATKEQLARMELVIPTEYNNLFLDNEEFIYVTMGNVKVEDYGIDVIRRLNPTGKNVLRDFGYGSPVGDYFFKTDGKITRFNDITVTDYKLYTALDGANGKLFTYDYDGNLLYVFGSNGDRKGNFTNAVSVAQYKDTLFVLDSGKNAIISFKMSKYGALVNDAVRLHYEGKYNEAANKWEEVLKFNANSDMAYIGLGRVLLRNGEYKKAMEYFDLANNRKYYSKAFTFYRREFLADKFGAIVTGLIITFIIFIFARFMLKRYRKNRESIRRKATNEYLLK